MNNNSTSIVRKPGIEKDNRLDRPEGWFPCFAADSLREFYSLSITFSQDLVCIGPGNFQTQMIQHSIIACLQSDEKDFKQISTSFLEIEKLILNSFQFEGNNQISYA